MSAVKAWGDYRMLWVDRKPSAAGWTGAVVVGLLAVGLPGLAAGGPPAAAPPPVPADHAERMERGAKLFAAKVRPVFLARCVSCHGGAKTMAGLDMADRESLLK